MHYREKSRKDRSLKKKKKLLLLASGDMQDTSICMLAADADERNFCID